MRYNFSKESSRQVVLKWGPTGLQLVSNWSPTGFQLVSNWSPTSHHSHLTKTMMIAGYNDMSASCLPTVTNARSRSVTTPVLRQSCPPPKESTPHTRTAVQNRRRSHIPRLLQGKVSMICMCPSSDNCDLRPTNLVLFALFDSYPARH